MQGRIDEWIRDWRLSPADSRDLYLDTAALLRTNKVSNQSFFSSLLADKLDTFVFAVTRMYSVSTGKLGLELVK